MKKKVLMIGTHLDTKGGISSVAKVYQQGGLFERFGVDYLASHCDGGAFKKLKVMLLAYFHFVGYLVRGRVSLIHVHVASRASFWRKSVFLLLGQCFGIPTILHLHGAEFELFYSQECGRLRQAFIRYIFDHTDRVVVLSEAWRSWVSTITANPHVEAIYNPVILPDALTAWGDRKSGSILSLGRIGKRKGSYDLLDAAARIVAETPGLSIRLGGDGEVEGARNRAVQLGLQDHLELLGWVAGADKERELRTATVYVLPSYNEGLPMSVLEAMAAGLPIVSTPVGGIPEAVSDGTEGFLVQPGDVAALSAKLACLLSDPVLAQRMGQAAHRKVETCFSAQAILPKIEQMYREIGCEAA